MIDAALPPNEEELLWGLLDRPLSVDERGRLRAWLARDPAARELYLAQMSLEGLLQWRAEPDSGEPGGVPAELLPAARTVKATVPASQPITPPLARGWARWSREIAFWSIVGAITWLGWSLFFLALQTPAHEPLASSKANDGPRVARLTRTASARWQDEAAAPLQGAALRRGQTLRLASGFAEVGFAHGATVVVQGPAEWEVLGERALRLSYGRVVGRVAPTPHEPGEEHFVVETNGLRVVDLGTEFGVEAHADERTRIYVFEGQVEVRPRVPRDATAASLLNAGESATYHRSQLQVERQAAPPKRFVRSLDQLGTKIIAFSGADPGEGLDLEGEFTYAINFHGPSIQVGEVLFQNDADVAELTVDAPLIYRWKEPIQCGESPADQALAQVLDTMIFAVAPKEVRVTLRVRPGARYRLQLLWYEQIHANRTFGIELAGEPVARSFQPALSSGRAVVHEFVADSALFEIRLPAGVGQAIHPNPTLQALTLKEVAEGEIAAPVSPLEPTSTPMPEVQPDK